MIVLPPETRCRAYHWPKEDEGATIVPGGVSGTWKVIKSDWMGNIVK